MKRINAAALTAVLLLTLVGCEAQKSSNPLSPSVAGPIGGVNITAPTLLEPGQGFKYKESQQPIKLVIENATTTGVRPISYMFEVAADANFESKVYARAGVPGGGDGRTSVQIDRLDLGRAYYWRARAEDGANTGQFSSAQFEVLPKPQLNAPGLISPVNNERVTSRRPTLAASTADRNKAVGDLRYEFQIATDQGFGGIVSAGTVDESQGQTTFTPGADLAVDHQYFWRVRASDGDTTSAWGPTQTFRTPAAPTPTPTPTPGGANVPGCVNGVLADPKAYFFALIGRTEGQPAGDWAEVLQRSGIPGGPRDGQIIPANAPHFGITQQINSSGQVRGRVFLPTVIPDEWNYYISNVDILSGDGGNLRWAWKAWNYPPYAPRSCH